MSSRIERLSERYGLQSILVHTPYMDAAEEPSVNFFVKQEFLKEGYEQFVEVFAFYRDRESIDRFDSGEIDEKAEHS